VAGFDTVPTTEHLNVAPKRFLASTRPAMVPGLILDSDELDFEIPARVDDHVSKYGFGRHLLLVHLTDEAVLRATTGIHAKSHLEYDAVSQTLKAEEKALSKDGEDLLTVAEWKQAWLRLIQLKKQYLLGNEWQFWDTHQKQIEKAPDAMGLKFKVWLRYDIAVWKRSTRKGLDPRKFHAEIFQRAHTKWTKECAVASMTAAMNVAIASVKIPASNAPPAAAAGSHSFPAAKSASGAGAKSTPPVPHCLCCGRRLHSSHACAKTTIFSGAPLFVLGRVASPAAPFKDKSGANVCIRWNQSKTCHKGGVVAHGTCRYQHLCTICGGAHPAGKCPSAKP
jgi:hypothetical protein